MIKVHIYFTYKEQIKLGSVQRQLIFLVVNSMWKVFARNVLQMNKVIGNYL